MNRPPSTRSSSRPHVLVVRLDSAGDVLLTGPAIRAVAAGARRVTALVGPGGAAAAALLPGVDETVVWECPWIVGDPEAVAPDDIGDIVSRLSVLDCDEAVIFTSFHQSPLPTALVLRLAGVPRISATSVDYPGSLLDVRHRPQPTDGPHEVEFCLSTARAAGFELPNDDAGLLAVRGPLPDVTHLLADPSGTDAPRVALHVGASVPARSPEPASLAQAATLLAGRGWDVVVTGGPAEIALAAEVAGEAARSLAGRTSLGELAAVLAQSDVVVSGNTGPAHLAAAVGTPVVSLFAPVVPLERWRPWGVPTVVLGDLHASCRDTRSRVCPIPGHPCLSGVSGSQIAAAVESLLSPSSLGDASSASSGSSPTTAVPATAPSMEGAR